MRNMLRKNITRKDSEIAFRNLITMLIYHDKKYEVIRIPIDIIDVYINLRKRKESGKDSIAEYERKSKIVDAKMKILRFNGPAGSKLLMEMKKCILFVWDCDDEFLKDIGHAAYCGCDGCWKRVSGEY